MNVTNLTSDTYWFGPLCCPAGVTITVDDTSETSLYLTNVAVASAINNLAESGKILVTSAAPTYPRTIGEPTLLHGVGHPDGQLFAPTGSTYLRRDNSSSDPTATILYVKTSNLNSSTGWESVSTSVVAIPTGVIHAYAGSTAPSSDWLLCDGSTVSKTDYPALYAVIGTLYGGNGNPNFMLPDLRGRVAVGFAASGGHTDVSTLGLNEGPSTLANRRPRHPHTFALTITDPAIHDYVSGPAVTGSDAPSSAQLQSTAIGGTIGLAGTASDAPAYLVVNYIIKT